MGVSGFDVGGVGWGSDLVSIYLCKLSKYSYQERTLDLCAKFQ